MVDSPPVVVVVLPPVVVVVVLPPLQAGQSNGSDSPTATFRHSNASVALMPFEPVASQRQSAHSWLPTAAFRMNKQSVATGPSNGATGSAHEASPLGSVDVVVLVDVTVTVVVLVIVVVLVFVVVVVPPSQPGSTGSTRSREIDGRILRVEVRFARSNPGRSPRRC